MQFRYKDDVGRETFTEPWFIPDRKKLKMVFEIQQIKFSFLKSIWEVRKEWVGFP